MEQLQKSKIQNLQQNGTWEGNFGLMYKYDMLLENGHSGEYSSKKYTSQEQLPFKVGDVIEYEYKDGQYPKIVKPMLEGANRDFNSSGSYKENNSNPDVQKMIVRQSSLQRSIEVLMHNNQDAIIKPSDAIKYAEFFSDWVMKDYNPETPKVETPKVETPKQKPMEVPTPQIEMNQKRVQHSTNEVDYLPF